ncbi:hypothetical protein R3P38DRAFT_3234818 [Favolaschia claudopus]|uniref:Protein kinase domain-containing protein n=1 Tax=Favolaschia claudopus TaxID=2862362 RepID=A0AAV9ZFH1_9AGAR
MFSRHTIRSRGTVCWGATYKDKTYVVKDYWCADGRMSEPGMLAKLVGVRGVGQIFAFETDRESIRTERGFGATLMHSDSDATEVVLGRTLMRVVVRRYGDTLEQAHSAHKLLCAIRDIVRGHRDSLLERGILHRDISFNNLLLSELSEDGEGVIIDWDLAIELIKILGGSTKGDSRTGTRAFQSIKVLKASPLLGHHDHMDDLESVFYVLYYVLYGHGPTGTRLPDEDMQIILDWENPTLNATTVSRNKAGFMVTAFEQPLTRYDGAEKDRLETFMQELQALFKVRCESIAAALKNRNPVEFPRFTKEAATADYENFLAIVDAAIADIPEPAPSFKRKQPDTTDGAHASYVLPSPPKSRRLSNVGLRGSHSSRGQTSSLGGAKGSGLRMSMPAEGETPTKPTHTHASTSSTSNNGSPLRRGRGQRKSRVTKSTYVESEDSDEGEKKTDDDYVEGNRRKGKGKGKRP